MNQQEPGPVDQLEQHDKSNCAVILYVDNVKINGTQRTVDKRFLHLKKMNFKLKQTYIQCRTKLKTTAAPLTHLHY